MKHDYTTLLHFLHTGELGELKPGMAEQAVRDYLGEPDYVIYDEALTDTLAVEFLRYGCLDIELADNRVVGIEVYIEKYPEYTLPTPIPDNWLASLHQMTAHELSNFLDSHGFKQDDYALPGTIGLHHVNLVFWFTDHNRLQCLWHG